MDTDVRVIKVIADYDCHPLWRRGVDGMVNIDPATLPITSELAQDLSHWAAAYDGTLDRSDPLASGFEDRAKEDGFYEWGARLAHRLAAELSPRYKVEYLDGRGGTPRSVGG